jgi:cobalamin biosynthesis Mg chelatase CobN
MPSPAAADRGARVAQAILDQHTAANDGAYPETVSVNLWRGVRAPPHACDCHALELTPRWTRVALEPNPSCSSRG